MTHPGPVRKQFFRLRVHIEVKIVSGLPAVFFKKLYGTVLPLYGRAEREKGVPICTTRSEHADKQLSRRGRSAKHRLRTGARV
jgi:hypothetical protein